MGESRGLLQGGALSTDTPRARQGHSCPRDGLGPWSAPSPPGQAVLISLPLCASVSPFLSLSSPPLLSTFALSPSHAHTHTHTHTHTQTRACSSDLDKDHEAVIVSPSCFWADTHSESRAVWANRPLPWAPGCPSLKHQTSQVGSRQTPGHCCIAGSVLGAWSVTNLGG